MDKLIFLDIDGVLNNFAMSYSDEYYKLINNISTIRGRLSSTNIKNLNYITDKTGAKIVISSSWRVLSDLDEMRDILANAGVTGEIIGVTPELGSDTLRGNEIHRYIKDNYSVGDYQQKLRYVILDDDSDILYWQRNNFFLCDFFCGLSPGVAYKAVRFLNDID